jgi:hypothetical protein
VTITIPFIEQNSNLPSAVFQATGQLPALQALVFIPSLSP